MQSSCTILPSLLLYQQSSQVQDLLDILAMPVPFPFRCQIRDIARWLSVTLEVPGETQARVLYQVRRR